MLFGIGLIEFLEPPVEIFDFSLEEISKLPLRIQGFLDLSHEQSEEADSQKLYSNLEHVLIWRVAFEISIADCRQSGHNPINSRNIEIHIALEILIGIRLRRLVSVVGLDPTALHFVANQDPAAG